MNSKERVYAALRREPTDRVPIFMWYHPQTRERLGKLLEVPPQYVPIVMGDDIRQTWVSNNYPMEGVVHERDGQSHVDDWGIEWTRIDGFNQISKYPLINAGPEQMLRYKFPYDRRDPLVDLMKPVMELRRDYFVGCDVSPCVFEMYWRLQGMEKTLMELSLQRDLAKEMMRRCTEFSIALSEAACRRFDLDWLWLGDDAGGQRSMLMSPDMWRDMVKPFLKQNADVAKRRGLYAAFHSCGAVRPIIPDLIEIGLDVLNPIQPACMDPAELKSKYGDKLCFWGSMDEQHTLPFGSATDVQAEVQTRLNTIGKHGGLILGPTHHVQLDTPLENFWAMVNGITQTPYPKS